MKERNDIAYYYPAPFWSMQEGGWVKTLLLFFDRVSILLPGYMYGRHHVFDPVLAEPLEDQGLLEILEPNAWIGQDMAHSLAEAVRGLLANGVFDNLPTEERFHELSQSRLGYGADVDLAESLVSELTAKGLARPSEDGVSIPLHPTVRTTILVLLAQLARSASNEPYLYVHPATNNVKAIRDLSDTLSREPMPSHNNLITLDLEPVSLDMDSVPLDELLEFRSENKDAHRAYMKDLRRFMFDLAEIQDPNERLKLMLERREEIADSARDLQRCARKALTRDMTSWSLAIVGSAWSIYQGDVFGLILVAAGLSINALLNDGGDSNRVGAYSYLFQADRAFGR